MKINKKKIKKAASVKRINNVFKNVPVISTFSSGRKRGRPRKQQRPQIIEISSNDQYNYAQEENFKAHLKKIKEIFKIRTVKNMMSMMYEVRNYTQASWKFGQLDLPFPPAS